VVVVSAAGEARGGGGGGGPPPPPPPAAGEERSVTDGIHAHRTMLGIHLGHVVVAIHGENSSGCMFPCRQMTQPPPPPVCSQATTG
jgi:hypothetical protein